MLTVVSVVPPVIISRYYNSLCGASIPMTNIFYNLKFVFLLFTLESEAVESMIDIAFALCLVPQTGLSTQGKMGEPQTKGAFKKFCGFGLSRAARQLKKM